MTGASRREPSSSPASEEDAKRAVADGYQLVANGWDRWRQEFARAGAPLTAALISKAAPKPGERVLDLGCGVGEPALSLAPLVAPGDVVGIDIASEMVKFASRAARIRGVANVTFSAADAEALPLSPNSFDLVTCRGAVVHFPDPFAALAETHRVLKRHARAVFTALGAKEETPLIEAALEPIARHLPAELTPERRLDPYRFAIRGTLAALFRDAEFTSVHEHHLVQDSHWPTGAEAFWSALPDHAWGIAESLKKLPAGTRDAVTEEVITNLRRFEHHDGLRFATPVVIVSGKK